MAYLQEFSMPLMGEGVNEATLIKWLKKPGDQVQEDEPIVEVSTDKVDTEIPSPFTGVLKETLAEPDDKILVDQVLAKIETETAPIAKKARAKAAPSTDKKKSAAKRRRPKSTSSNRGSQLSQNTDGTVRLTPIARQMVQDYDVDLAQIKGTGLSGRITKADLNKYLNHGATPVENLTFDGDHPLFQLETQKEGDSEKLEGVEVRRETMSKMRTLIAEHMNRSIRTSPHVTTTFEVDMGPVVNHRTKNKAAYIEKHGLKLTYTHYIVHAAIQTIKEFPIVNVSVDGNDILWKDDINIGVAVAIESGLIVPVLKKTQNLSLIEIGKSVNELAANARNKKLKPSDIVGGTFSITNPGLYGSITSNPIINQPQVAILGVGAIQKLPVVQDDQVQIGHRMMVSLTFDHRVIDGEIGAKYLAAFKKHLEAY